MLAQALILRACSNSPALPSFLCLPLWYCMGKDRGGLPQAQCSACLQGRGKRKYRVMIDHSTRTRGHKATFKQGREKEESKQKQIRTLQIQVSLADTAITESLLSLNHSHAIMAWHTQNDCNSAIYDSLESLSNTQSWSPSLAPTSATWVTRVRNFLKVWITSKLLLPPPHRRTSKLTHLTQLLSPEYAEKSQEAGYPRAVLSSLPSPPFFHREFPFIHGRKHILPVYLGSGIVSHTKPENPWRDSSGKSNEVPILFHFSVK